MAPFWSYHGAREISLEHCLSEEESPPGVIGPQRDLDTARREHHN